MSYAFESMENNIAQIWNEPGRIIWLVMCHQLTKNSICLNFKFKLWSYLDLMWLTLPAQISDEEEKLT